jgi:hypothetical protein
MTTGLGVAVTALLPASAIVLVHICVTVSLILTTPKGSLLRYLWIPFATWLAYVYCDLSRNFTTSDARNFVLASAGVIVLAQTLKLTLLDPLDIEELAKSNAHQHSASLYSRLWHLAPLVLCTRGINTPWQVKNIPPHSAYYARQGKRNNPNRSSFLRRELIIFGWQYLLLDVMYLLSLQTAPNQERTEFRWFGVPLSEWVSRLCRTMILWFLGLRVAIDSSYRATTIAGVSLGLTTPANCRPLFGSMWDAYSLRNYWGYVLLPSPILFFLFSRLPFLRGPGRGCCCTIQSCPWTAQM